MRLLIIDDEPSVRRSIEMIASLDGWETFSCDQFSDVVQIISDKAIDVLFCDYRMPPFTGIDIVRRIRAASLRLPIIMISANPDKIDPSVADELRIDRILRKPPDVKDVRKVLAGAAADTQLPAESVAR